METILNVALTAEPIRQVGWDRGQLPKIKFGPVFMKFGRRAAFSGQFFRPVSEQPPLTAARALILHNTNTLIGAKHSQNT